MAQWQTELETLLAKLQVSSGGEAFPSDGVSSDDAVGTIPWELSALVTEEAPADDVEVSAIRSEIEATIEQVVSLVHAGRLEGALRDDVVFVLRALTRPHPPFSSTPDLTDVADEHQEWHLASAAAVLRFCRIVQRLIRDLDDETEL